MAGGARGKGRASSSLSGANQLGGLSGDLRCVAEAFQPHHIRFAAKPSHLALGVVAMSLLCRRDCLLAREFATQELCGLLVTQRLERRDVLVCAVAFKETSGLVDQAIFEHLLRALIDAGVQL